MRIGFICFVLVSWLCFGSTHGRSHEHLKHTKSEIHASQILTKESKLNVEKEATNSNEDLIKEIASPKDASEIQENVAIKTILTENDSAVQENSVNKIVIVHNVTNQNQQQPLEGKEKVEQENKKLKQHLPDDEILQNEQLKGEKLQTEQQQQKKTENQKDQHHDKQEEQQQVEKENQKHQKHEQKESQDQKQEGEEEQNTINQGQKQDPQGQLEEEKKVEEQQEKTKHQHQQQLDKQQKQVKHEKENQQQQQVSDNTDVVLNKQEHENKIAVSMKKEENPPINDKPNIKRQNIDLYEVDKPMKEEQHEKNVFSNSENEIKLSSSVNTSLDYLYPKNEQMLKINDNKKENLDRNEDKNKLREQNTNPKSEKDQHQKIKSKHNNKNVSKAQVKKQILHPLAEAKNTFHKKSEVESMKNITINNSNNELNTKTDDHNTSETNQYKKKATENNTEAKVTKTELLEKLTDHKTENNQSDHSKVLNKLKDDKSTINESKLHSKNKSRVSFSHHREEHINKDQGPEKMKDVIKSKSSTQKTSDPKQKEETSNMKQNEKHENELVIKLRSELDEEEDKYLEKEKENHAKSSTTQNHKKKYSTAIITVSLTLIISTVLLSIAGIYYSKISLDGRRYYGHTLLPTEEDISLYTRTNYNDDVDRYESWNSS